MATSMSQQCTGISYLPCREAGKDNEELGLPFSFDVTGELAAENGGMDTALAYFDDLGTLRQKAILYLKAALYDKGTQRYETIHGFLENHCEDFSGKTMRQLLWLTSLKGLTLQKMVERLRVTGFGSFIASSSKEQVFTVEMGFNPDLTEERITVYFNREKEAIDISHEQ